MEVRARFGLVLAALLVACVGCAGDGGSFSAIEATVTDKCGVCHDATGFERLIDEVLSLDDAVFDDERFAVELFAAGLAQRSPEDLIANANPPRDATIDPSAPRQKAWILHLLYILDEQLRAEPSSDFTSEATFNAYNSAGTPPSGCTAISRVGNLADLGVPQQMPPLWTEPLFDAIGRPFAAVLASERTALIENIEANLPNGRLSCLTDP